MEVHLRVRGVQNAPGPIRGQFPGYLDIDRGWIDDGLGCVLLSAAQKTGEELAALELAAERLLAALRSVLDTRRGLGVKRWESGQGTDEGGVILPGREMK